MAFDPTGNGLSGVMGNIFGYGTEGQNAAGQLASQGVAGPAQINTAQSEQDRQNQQALLSMLTAQAQGTGPSAAQAQLSQGIQATQASQAAQAAGGHYGQNAALRQQGVAAQGAGIQEAGANQAAQLRENQMATGAQQAAGAAGGMRGQDVSQATAQAQLQNAYNQQLGSLYGAEQGQQAQAGQALQSSVMNALGGGASMANNASGTSNLGNAVAGMAHGGIAGFGMGGISEILPLLAAHGALSATKTLMGERQPEAMIPLDPKSPARLIDHPMMATMKRPAAIVPLAKGSAPYTPGPLPSVPGGGPTRPAPRKLNIDPEALAAMAGRGPTHSPGPGGAGLSPRTAPIVGRAMAAHGMLAR